MTTKEAIAQLCSGIGIMDAPTYMKALSTITRQLRNERKVWAMMAFHCEHQHSGMCEWSFQEKKCTRRNCPAIKGRSEKPFQLPG